MRATSRGEFTPSWRIVGAGLWIVVKSGDGWLDDVVRLEDCVLYVDCESSGCSRDVWEMGSLSVGSTLTLSETYHFLLLHGCD